MNRLTIIGLALFSIHTSAHILNDYFIDYGGFIDVAVIGEEQIQLAFQSIDHNTVTLKFESEAGKEYTITQSSDLSPGSWNIDGTTVQFNGIEVNGEGSDRYFYTATSTHTIVEISYTGEVPLKAFFKAAEFIQF